LDAGAAREKEVLEVERRQQARVRVMRRMVAFVVVRCCLGEEVRGVVEEDTSEEGVESVGDIVASLLVKIGRSFFF
jgi:hypothetical protein